MATRLRLLGRFLQSNRLFSSTLVIESLHSF